MKICFATHTYPPGETAANKYCANFVSTLVNLGYEVTVITMNHIKNSPQFEYHDNLNIIRLHADLPYFLHGFEFMSRIKPVLDNLITKEKFDIVHSEHIFPAPYLGIVTKKHNLPHVVTIEGVSDVSLYSRALFQFHKFLLPKINCDILVSWSKFMEKEYFINWGIKKKIITIPGAVDIKTFNPFVKTNEIKEKLNVDGKIILTAKPMYLTNALGMLHIIKAMKSVSKEYEDCKLIVGGTGRMENKLKQLARKLSLDKYIKFIGWIPQKDIPLYYKAANVIVDSFIFKHPGSMTVLESLASGTPNVLTEIECLPGDKNIPSKDIAVLSKVSNSESIANGILRLLQDRKLCKRLGKNAWNFIKNNFTSEIIAKRYSNLYESLI